MIEIAVPQKRPMIPNTLGERYATTYSAIRGGIGRQTAHAAIRDNAVAVALDMRQNGTRENDLLDRLAADNRLGISRSVLAEAISKPIEFVGSAPNQIGEFAKKVAVIAKKYPTAATYNPEPIL